DLVQRVGLLSPGAAAIDDALQRFEVKDKLADRLEKARVLLRPGEFVLLALASAAAIGMWVTLLSDRPVLGIALALFTPFGFRAYLDLRIGRRRRAFEIQLPATLSLLASSLRAGHTLLRAIELQVEEGREPMAGELERVLAETQL
ncbi:type II secretion system F family protein, partial [Acinetobacter nosocomialis]|uniref:type II secretion system F family protein n=1 Tax=Acinetobacter nosocomialis TaxID=106654 RepID=UPI001C06FE11